MRPPGAHDQLIIQHEDNEAGSLKTAILVSKQRGNASIAASDRPVNDN